MKVYLHHHEYSFKRFDPKVLAARGLKFRKLTAGSHDGPGALRRGAEKWQQGPGKGKRTKPVLPHLRISSNLDHPLKLE